MKKKIYVVAFALIIVLALIPAMAFAQDASKTYTAKGMTWKLNDQNAECKLLSVDEQFDGTIPEKITNKDGKVYHTAALIDEISWQNTKVSTLRIPDVIPGANADAFKQAQNITSFEVYPAYNPQGELPILKSDKSGILYECEYYDCEEIACRLVAYPNGKIDAVKLQLMAGTTEINQYAFEYCKDLSKMKKLLVSDNKLYLDLMGAEEPGSISIDALTKNNRGEYDFANFTISLANPDYDEETMDEYDEYFDNKNLFEYARMRGMKIEASLLYAKVCDVKYNKSHKYNPKVIYGSTVLVPGKDYEYDYHQKLSSIGMADISLFGRGDFEHTGILTSYDVKPYNLKIKKPISGKNEITVKWKSDKNKYGKKRSGKAIHVTGYQVAYKKSNNSRLKYKTIKGYTRSSLTIKGLKSNQKYIVRVRSYKNIDGQTVYSSWSGTQKVKTKR